ncbi:hypothetical protein OSJ77_19845 [Phyllobacterium sp. 0TCS1.6C]|uniref:hypothetical protein n=1 Tax=unclassified Phyllobacterium TaxID=2638441 RepID=UPI0022648708|nr:MULTISPECIES: hypothetical protein [unclassified Phyllobacterium]MCX8282447.1 hypothetical protein [Phyllobacterium sp. 0TCS1.6C]MCX8292539.1 hypothetical protein [Phyllobacterium sp. 0TCS1.6A]
MPDALNRTTEAELSACVLQILSERDDGSASFGQLIDEIPNRLPLTPEDFVQSGTRPHEAVWEQRVRNIKSHKENEGNAIADGYLEEIPAGLRITEAGRRQVT